MDLRQVEHTASIDMQVLTDLLQYFRCAFVLNCLSMGIANHHAAFCLNQAFQDEGILPCAQSLFRSARTSMSIAHSERQRPKVCRTLIDGFWHREGISH